MHARSTLAAVVFATLLAALAACVVKLTGGPCQRDTDCAAPEFCSPGGFCAEGARTPLPVASACQQVVSAWAGAASVCLGGSGTSWLKAENGAAICSSIQGSVAAGRLAYDSSRLHQCMGDIADAGCAGLINGFLPPCAVFQAEVAVGAECHSSLDCQDGFCDTRSSCPGTCAPFVRPGDACDADAGLRCPPGDVCYGGVCQQPGGIGAPCSATLACETTTSYCSGGTCAARLTAGGCFPPSDPSLQCALNYTCAGPFLTYTCQPALAEGSTCAPTFGQCALFLYCSKVSQTCTEIGVVGGACAYVDSFGEYVNCLDGWCQAPAFSAGICRPFQTPGQSCVLPDGGAGTPCGPNAHCAASGVCVQDICP